MHSTSSLHRPSLPSPGMVGSSLPDTGAASTSQSANTGTRIRSRFKHALRMFSPANCGLGGATFRSPSRLPATSGGAQRNILAKASVDNIPEDQIPLPPIRKFVPVGVIGGMGPDATNDLNAKMLEEARRIDPAPSDQDNIGVIAYNVPHLINDRTGYLNRVDINQVSREEWQNHLTSPTTDNPLWGMLHAAKQLQAAGAHLLVMPCNTAHMFHPELEKRIDIPVLHIADAALMALKEANPAARKVGLLATSGTINNRLYEGRAEKVHPSVEWVYPTPASQRDEVMGGIYVDGVKAYNLENGRRLLKSAGDAVVEKHKPDALFLACTEIPLVLSQKDYPDQIVIDATQALAKLAAQMSFELAQKYHAQRDGAGQSRLH